MVFTGSSYVSISSRLFVLFCPNRMLFVEQHSTADGILVLLLSPGNVVPPHPGLLIVNPFGVFVFNFLIHNKQPFSLFSEQNKMGQNGGLFDPQEFSLRSNSSTILLNVLLKLNRSEGDQVLKHGMFLSKRSCIFSIFPLRFFA